MTGTPKANKKSAGNRNERAGGQVLRGIPVSHGVAIGRIAKVKTTEPRIVSRDVPEGERLAEIERFRKAIREVTEEIRVLRDAMAGELGPEGAAIFDAQLMILQDPLAIDSTENDIRSLGKNAEFLFRQNVLRVLEQFDAMQEGLFKERTADIRDVTQRVLRRLTGAETVLRGSPPPQESIMVARELSPGDTVSLGCGPYCGLATEKGGSTSHVAIMARARRIPAVMGISSVMNEVRSGTRAILDGWRGVLILNPSQEEEERYQRVREHYADLQRRLALLRELPSVTTDGHEVHLHANIEMPSEAENAMSYGASGVGLFRTEFFFMQRSRLPTEAEQFEAYRNVVELMAPNPVVIRTMDLGGDKFASYIGADREKNPFLGFRGIRFLLGHEEVFRCQLRAILRASAHGAVRILFPMISTVEELRTAKQLIAREMATLEEKGIAHDRGVQLGVMIETPAAVFISDVLAKACDFFSIGSNDLTQYTLAVDRTNARLDYLFTPFHPSVLRAIRATVHAAHRGACQVSLCGEMASDPLATVLLVGLGIDDLSMSPALIPEVKQIIRSITFDEGHDIATRAVRLSTSNDVVELVKEFMRERFPELSEVKGW